MGGRAAGLALLLSLSACSHNQPRNEPGPPPKRTAPEAPLQVVLASNGRAHVVVVAPSRLRESAVKDDRRLVASVTDLASYLGRISGAQVELIFDNPGPADGSIPILVGELAEKRFGPIRKHAPGKQAFRVVVDASSLGLFGESDLATSYAIYELLDRLGCRWFMPGALGEDVPRRQQLSIAQGDDSLVPSTLYRDLWYADEDFKRRNRLGGLQLAAGHQLEKWITAQQRDEHPEWRAQIKGNFHPTRLRWSSPEVAQAIADNVAARLAKKPADSVSLSPADGVDFDETLDRTIDGGDWDPTLNTVSVTDRLLVLANRVAAHVTPKNPDLMLGLLAYVSYTRPPVRETVHPNVVPVIAPITYCRPRPWSDDRCPGAKDIRGIVEGWSRRAEKLAFRGYAYNLAEPAAPHPMMAKWSFDLPFLFAHRTRFFQPETLPNFETTLPALYLGIRLSWQSEQNPELILERFFERFYGHAGKAARAYWELIDRAWTDAPEYSGGGLGYAQRFPPSLLAAARSKLDAAATECRTETERQRVAMLDASLSQLELYMQLQRDFQQGRLAPLAGNAAQWLTRARELADRYAVNSAFGKARWAGQDGVYASYFKRFLEPIYSQASRLAREQVLLSRSPWCRARHRLAPDLKLPTTDSPMPLSDADKSTDFCSETWSTLGQHDYFGAMWYEADLELTALPVGKRAFAWVSRVDGLVQVWVNGVAVRLKDAAADAAPGGEAHLKSLTFEIASALHAQGKNRISVLVQRTRLAELGGGGLLGPVYFYRDL